MKEILENLFKLILCTYGTQSVQFLTLILTHRHTDTYRHTQTQTQTNRHTDTHRHTQTYTDRHRHTDTDTDTDTDTHTHTHIKERETTKNLKILWDTLRYFGKTRNEKPLLTLKTLPKRKVVLHRYELFQFIKFANLTNEGDMEQQA